MSRFVFALLLLSLASPVVAQQRSVTDLIADLKKADPEKLKAIEAIDALGPKAADAAPALIDLLSLPNEDVRLAATLAIGKIGAAAVDPVTERLQRLYAPPKNIDQINNLVNKLGSSAFKERDLARKELEAIGHLAIPALEEMIGKKTDVETIRRAEELVKTIKGTSSTRYYTVWTLAFIGAPAKKATPEVLQALKDSSADVRRKAAYVLGRIDADPKNVVGALVAALGDPDNDVRQTAAESLPRMSNLAVPVLIQVLQGEKADLKVMAIQILGKIGAEAAPAIPELKGFLLDAKAGALTEPAADALAGIGTPSLKALTAAAAHDNANVRALAVRSLHKIGGPAVPVFVDLLGAKDVDVQRQVAALLGTMQVQDKSVVIGLGFATKDKDFQVRMNALQSLRQMGTSAKLAEPYIVALLIDIDPQMRLNAFHALNGLGVDPRPGLKKALASGDLKTRITTASLITEPGLNFSADVIEVAVPVLVEGIKQKDESLKMQAAHALSQRGLAENEVLPIFIAGLKNETPSVRRQAAEMIARYGAKASKAAPDLIKALDDKDDAVCIAALQTLRGIGADPKSLFPAMVKVLRRPDPKLHPIASQIIFQVGPDAIPELIDMLKKEDAAGVRLACLQTLAMVGPPAKDAVSELIKTLDDPSARVRMTAARALGNIGPDAKAAEKALTKATKDTDGNVQSIANAALAQIRAEPNQKNFEVKGVLTPGDPFDKVRQGHFHVVHTFNMKKGQTYTIDLISQWDNFLRLENPQGVMIAQDDDGGGFPNARITIAAQTDGWHRIIVTSFGQGGNGPYTLRVK